MTIDELLADWTAATAMSPADADAMVGAITATAAPRPATSPPRVTDTVAEQAAWWRQHQRELARTLVQATGFRAA